MLGKAINKAFIFIIYAWIYIPISILVLNSFNVSRFGINWQGFSTKWYALLIHNSSLFQATKNSLIMAIISASFATVLGSLTAVLLYRYHTISKKFIVSMLFLVMLSPDIVMAISLLVLFIILKISLGFWSLLFCHITFCLPFVVVSVYTRLNGFNVFMLEAAKDLGAQEIMILYKIILPLVMPAVIGAWLLGFTLSMDDVVISSFLTSPTFETLPLKIYSMVKVGISPEINALASILLLLSLLLVASSQFLSRNRIK